MSTQGDLLAHKARALAQSHPFSPLAKRFADRAAAGEQESQSLAVVADWASSALTAGYCLRRVEEIEVGITLAAAAGGTEPTLDELDRQSQRVTADLRSSQRPADSPYEPLLDEELIVVALDRIITSEVSRRQDNVRDGVDDAAWNEFEEYIAWWVIRGYALRVSEATTGALV
ncbi:MAG: hypothetical protein ACRD1K_18055 [Acidimicrobiales bacterium]